MDSIDLNAIYESYMQIYEEKDEDEEESCEDEKKSKKKMKESYDHYDIVLEYLLDEGLCESVENAEIMMAHMSEAWIDDILESYELDEANIMSVSRGGKPVYKRSKYSSDELENIRKTNRQQRRLRQLRRANESDYRASQREIKDSERYEKDRRKHPTNIMNAKPGKPGDYQYSDAGPNDEYHYSLKRTDRAARRRRELGK